MQEKMPINIKALLPSFHSNLIEIEIKKLFHESCGERHHQLEPVKQQEFLVGI